MEDVGDQLERQMKAMVVVVAVGMFLVGAITVWGLPIVWEWVKPWLHQATG